MPCTCAAGIAPFLSCALAGWLAFLDLDSAPANSQKNLALTVCVRACSSGGGDTHGFSTDTHVSAACAAENPAPEQIYTPQFLCRGSFYEGRNEIAMLFATSRERKRWELCVLLLRKKVKPLYTVN